MTAGFGAFGKMPSLGDFFRVEVPPGFVDPWDRWLQEAMVTARAALGGRWQDSYFSAPIWRFSLAPGLAGASAATGVMMMSVDRVGRQFPLTLVQALPDGADPLLCHLTAEPTFAALEGVALDALEDGMTRERLAELLDVVAPALAVAPAIRREGGALVVTGPGDVLPGLAAEGLRTAARHPAIWSAEVDGTKRMMLSDGLPAGGALLALFDMEARLWTGRDAPTELIPEPAHAPTDLPPASDIPPQAATRSSVAPLPAHVPLEDPLADILGAEDSLFDVADPDDDPFEAILSGAEPSADEAPHLPAPGATQEA